jgi:2'-5' RNA ligase
MAFIGVKIPADITRLFRNLDIPGDKVPENEEHVTILCFEENWPIKDVAKAMETAFEVLKNVEPFQIKVSKVTCFPKHGDSPVAIIAKVDSKALHEVNDELKSAFDKKKIDYMKNFKEYKPHITLAYGEDEIKNIEITPISFTVTEVTLWAGDNGDDRLFITIPLKGASSTKHSFLVNKADLFHKLSSKDPNSVLSRTTERRLTKR